MGRSFLPSRRHGPDTYLNLQMTPIEGHRGELAAESARNWRRYTQTPCERTFFAQPLVIVSSHGGMRHPRAGGAYPRVLVTCSQSSECPGHSEI
jgi:hypothetical protein